MRENPTHFESEADLSPTTETKWELKKLGKAVALSAMLAVAPMDSNAESLEERGRILHEEMVNIFDRFLLEYWLWRKTQSNIANHTEALNNYLTDIGMSAIDFKNTPKIKKLELLEDTLIEYPVESERLIRWTPEYKEAARDRSREAHASREHYSDPVPKWLNKEVFKIFIDHGRELWLWQMTKESIIKYSDMLNIYLTIKEIPAYDYVNNFDKRTKLEIFKSTLIKLNK